MQEEGDANGIVVDKTANHILDTVKEKLYSLVQENLFVNTNTLIPWQN
ncbi:MAG TPA: hypothetical protein VGO09_09215 [Flavisolibacter sp.]|nr:hypothetical protein [Flavisolibacter sp.]